MFVSEEKFLIPFPPRQYDLLSPTSLKRPTRLHMIGHPARTCTCDSSAKSLPQSRSVLYSSGSLIRLVWSQEWAAVSWMYLATGPPPAPPCCYGNSGGSAGNSRAYSRAFSSNQDIVYQSLETAPSVAWWQCAISYCILKTDCLLCV